MGLSIKGIAVGNGDCACCVINGKGTVIVSICDGEGEGIAVIFIGGDDRSNDGVDGGVFIDIKAINGFNHRQLIDISNVDNHVDLVA